MAPSLCLHGSANDMIDKPKLRVGVGGLGVIGEAVAKALDAGIPGLMLAAVSSRDTGKARQKLAQLAADPTIVPLRELASSCDIVVECAPAYVYDEVAIPAVDAGRVLVTLSTAALLTRNDMLDRARLTGARIVVPSGGILGLDAICAAAEGQIQSVKLITRKPPASLAGAPYLLKNDIDVDSLLEPMKVFDGNAMDAARGFPANANVAATLSLAGIGPLRTRVEIWADPNIDKNTQEILVASDSADFRLTVSSHPMTGNPRTGSLTPKSVIAALRALTAGLTFAH